MPTGGDVLASAIRFRGYPYSTLGGRTDPASSGYCDCSGLVYAALVGVGVRPGGANSTGEETWAVNSGGGYVSRNYALTHPGVGLAIWGTGAQGHIKLSTGDGRSFGTPSDEGHQAGFERFDARGVNRYFTFPGITYEGQAPPAQEDDLPYSPEEVTRMVASGVERALQGPEGTRRVQELVQGQIQNMIVNDPATKDAIKQRAIEALQDTNLHDVVVQALRDAGVATV